MNRGLTEFRRSGDCVGALGTTPWSCLRRAGPFEAQGKQAPPLQAERSRIASVREYGPMRRILFGAIFLMVVGAPARGQKRLVLIDQDGSGPGGSNQMAMMVLLESPRVEVLGITIVTGNAWRDEEVQHTLRMLELIGRTRRSGGAWSGVSASAHGGRNADCFAAFWQSGLAWRLGAWADEPRAK